MCAAGHSQGFADSGSKQLRLKTLSLRPLIFEIHDFITMQECDHLISKARKHLGDSVVSKMDGDEGKSDTPSMDRTFKLVKIFNS